MRKTKGETSTRYVHEDTYVDIRGRGKRVHGLLIKVAENLPAYFPSPTLSPARSLPFSRAALPLPSLPSSPPSLPFPQITSRFSFFFIASRAPFLSPRRGSYRVNKHILHFIAAAYNALTDDAVSNNRVSRSIPERMYLFYLSLSSPPLLPRARDTCGRAQLENTIRRNEGLIISNGRPSQSDQVLACASARFAIII